MNINKKYSKKFSFINIIVNFYLMLGHANIITELEQTKSENSLETFKNCKNQCIIFNCNNSFAWKRCNE